MDRPEDIAADGFDLGGADCGAPPSAKMVRAIMNGARAIWIVAAVLFGTAGVTPNVLAAAPADIHRAAQAGDLERVNQLLAKSPGLLEAKSKSGQTPLHAAVLARELAVAERLLNAGAHIGATDKHAETPLHVAVRALRARAVEVLLKHQADVSARNDRGYTPLHAAAYYGGHDDEAVKLRGRITTLLLGAKADLTAQEADGLTALHLAALKGRAAMVDLLLAGGAEVNAKDQWGRSPLHHAAAGNHKAVIERLLAKGAEVNATDKLGETPLHSAARRFRREAAEALLAAGAQVDARNDGRATPLHVVASSGPDVDELDHLVTAVAAVLLANGADARLTDANGHTPLDRALKHGHLKLAELLRR